MTTVIFSVVLLLVMGAVFGAILAFAAKVFAVEKDPKEEAILGCRRQLRRLRLPRLRRLRRRRGLR